MHRSPSPGSGGSLRRTTSLAGAALGIAAGAVVAGVAAQRVVDRAVGHLPSHGSDVVVDGRRVHIEVWGSMDPDAPTVVAESGVGGTSADWEQVAGLLDGRVRLVALDRPGLGRSEPGSAPGVDGAAHRLEAIIGALGIEGPVVLAGWSMGALLWLGVALTRPDLVAALVLVDPSHPDEARRFGDPALHPVGRGMWRAVGIASRLGGAALAGVPSRLVYLRLSRRSRGEPAWQVATFATARAGQALASEMRAFPTLCDEVGAIRAGSMEGGPGEAPEVPCVLLSASRRRNESEARVWTEMHDDLAAWVPGAELIVVDRSGHDILADRPDVVAGTIGSITVGSGRAASVAPPVLSPG